MAIHFIGQCFHWSTTGSRWLTPIADLALRLYIARIFFVSGLSKIQHWPEVLASFHGTYHVPFLPPDLAAILATAGELILPVCIALGLGARIPAMALFAWNALAMYANPEIWGNFMACAAKDHFYWEILIAVLWFHGPGKISLDYLLVRRDT